MEIIEDIILRFSSRKFLLAVMGCLVVFGVDLSTAQITAITALIVAFTAVEGYKDALQ